MKRFEIMVSGEHEEEMSREILQAAYAAMQRHSFQNASVNARTVRDEGRQIQIPSFLCQNRAGTTAFRRRV